MATKKTIEFKAKFDLSEFDKGAQKIQERMRQITAPTATSAAMQKAQSMMAQLGIGQITPQDEARRRSYDNTVRQSQRELEQIAQRQWQAAQRLEVILDKRIEKLNKLKDLEKGLLLTNQDTSRIKEQIARSEERIALTRAKVTGRALNVQSAAESLQDISGYEGGYAGLQASPMDRIRRAYGMHGIGGAIGMAGRTMGGFGGLGFGAAALAAGAYNIYNTQSLAQRDYELSVRQAQGSVINQGPAGQALASIYSGQGTRFAYESAQRNTAISEAMKYRQDLERNTSLSGIASRAVAGAGAGAASGAFGGGLFAGLTGGVGAAAIPLLSALGGIGGGAGSLLRDLSNPLTRATMFGSAEERQSLLSSEAAKRYQQTLEAEKSKSPLKFLAQDQFLQNYQQDLGVQRSLGLSDAQFYGAEDVQSGNVVGGMYNNLLGRGFTRDEIMRSVGGVIQAGGSTAVAASQTGLVQQMQRAGISNAAQTMGTISRITGSVGETEQAAIKVMEEAFKRGLDKSEFRQESVKFQEVLTGAMASSGVVSGQGAVNAAQIMAGFISNPESMQSIGAAAGAKQFYESNLKNTLNQSIQAAGLMDIPGLGFSDANALLRMSTEELFDEGNMQVSAAAEAAGMSREELVQKVQQSKLNAVTTTKSGQQAVEGAKAAVSKKEQELVGQGMDRQKARQRAYQDFISSPEAGKLMNILGMESTGFQDLKYAEKQGVVAGVLGMEMTPIQSQIDVRDTLQRASDQQSIGNAQEEATAKQQKITNETFVQQGYTPLKQAAEKLKEMSASAMNAAMILESAVKSGDTTAITNAMTDFQKATEPPKAGASRPGK